MKASVGPNLACDTQPLVPQKEGECHTPFLTLHPEPEIFAVSSLNTLSTHHLPSSCTYPRQKLATVPGRIWGALLASSYQHLQLVWGPVASVHWQRDVKLVVETCLCGWAMVLFALFKLPNLVKLCSFEISVYGCTVEACLTSEFFVVKDKSILHSLKQGRGAELWQSREDVGGKEGSNWKEERDSK